MTDSLPVWSSGLSLIQSLPSKEKLIGDWRKTTQGLTEAGAELLLFTTVNAFKFPDNGQVYITCNVQVSFYTSLLDFQPGAK